MRQHPPTGRSPAALRRARPQRAPEWRAACRSAGRRGRGVVAALSRQGDPEQSVGVTTPSKLPCSSCTSAIGTSAALRMASTSSAFAVSATTGARRAAARRSSGRPASSAASNSRACTTPMTASGEPSPTGSRECAVRVSAARRLLAGAGVEPVDFPAGRHHAADRPIAEPQDARYHPPLGDLGRPPVRSASATRARTSSSVTLSSDLVFRPPEQAEDQVGGGVEQPAGRRGDPRDHRHGGATQPVLGSARANAAGR